MTGIGPAITSAVAAAAVAASGVAGALAGGSASDSPARSVGAPTALVVDASVGRDGRELIDPRLRALDAELRLPRTEAEAATDLRYFAAQDYRLVVAGTDSKAAAEATGLRVSTLPR